MKIMNPIYENVTTQKLNSLLKQWQEDYQSIVDEIDYSSYSINDLKLLKAKKKIAKDNCKSIAKELDARTV